MAKYSNTKAKINEKITTNAVQAITGNILNEVLQTMVDSLGADYQFGGLVQPGSTFTAGEQPVVFLATTPGTYTYFGSQVVADGEVALLVWSGTAWSKQTTDIATRTEVSQLGQKLSFTPNAFVPGSVSDGTSPTIPAGTIIQNANRISSLANNVGAGSELTYSIQSGYRLAISSWNGETAQITDKSGWLTGDGKWTPQNNLVYFIFARTTESAISPSDSTNVYIQTSASIEGRVSELKQDTESLKGQVGNIKNTIKHIEDPSLWDLVGQCAVSPTGTWLAGSSYESKSFNAVKYRGRQVSVTANSNGAAIVSFLVSINYPNNPVFATGETGRSVIPSGETQVFTIPTDAVYVVVTTKDTQDRTPIIVELSGRIDYSEYIAKQLEPLTYFNIADLRYFPIWHSGSVITSGANIGGYSPNPYRISSVMDVGKYSGAKMYAAVPEGYVLSYRTWDGVSSSMSDSSGWFTGVREIVLNGKYLCLAIAKENLITIIDIVDGNNVYIMNNPETATFFGHIFKANAVYPYKYNGERITLNQGFKPILYKTLPNWQNMQGGAIYGDKLVCLMATDEIPTASVNGFIYNIETGEKVCDLLFGNTLGGKTYELPHANQVSFGTQFYNANSRFPLLYVSQVNGGSVTLWNNSERGVLVYDLQTEDDGQTFTPVLVQAIIPDLEDTELMAKLGKYTPNYIVDTDKNQLVVLGYPNESWFILTGPQPVAIFNVPLISAGAEIVLTDEDVVDSYTLPISYGIQQSFYKNGKIYSSGGFASAGIIRVIDLLQKAEVSYIDLTQWTNQEPQFVGMYDNRFLYYSAGTSGDVYEILFT